MTKFLFDSKLIFVTLILLNGLIFLIIKSEKRYFLWPVSIWVVTCIIFMTYTLFILPYLKDRIELKYSALKNKTDLGLGNLSEGELLRHKDNEIMKLTSFSVPLQFVLWSQAVISFIILNVFYKKNNTDNRKTYRAIFIFLGVIAVLSFYYLSFIVLLGFL